MENGPENQHQFQFENERRRRVLSSSSPMAAFGPDYGLSKHTHTNFFPQPLISYSPPPDSPLSPQLSLLPDDGEQQPWMMHCEAARPRSNSVPSLCHSESTASSPSTTADLSPVSAPFDDFEEDEEHGYDFRDSPPKEDYHDHTFGLGLGLHDEGADYQDISPYPPSLTPPTFYSPLSAFSSPASSSFSSQDTPAPPDELTGLLYLQRRTQEDLARLDEAVQLHSSPPAFGHHTMLNSLKARRKAAKEKCKEVDGLVRFGLDHPLSSHHSPSKASCSATAAALMPMAPKSPRRLPPLFIPSLDEADASSSTSLLFPTLPSPINGLAKKKKKEPPSSIHHLLSTMLLSRGDRGAIKTVGGRSGGVWNSGGFEGRERRRSGLRSVVELEDSDADSDSMQVDVHSPDMVHDMEDDDLDELGLACFS